MSAHPFPSASGGGASSGRPPQASARPVVLVVDDSRFVRASIRRLLAPWFELREADGGERAWELLLLDESIAAVISDLTMSGVDGWELLRRVRASPIERLRGLPFVVLSGSDDGERRARAQSLGADRFIVKGASFEVVAQWLAQRLGVGVAALVPEPAAPQPVLVPDPIGRWLEEVAARAEPRDAPLALLRLHATLVDDLPARLRASVRALDSLYLESHEDAWLCLPSGGSATLRLALRLGQIAAQPPRGTPASGNVCVAFGQIERAAVDGDDGRHRAARRLLAALRALTPAHSGAGRIAVQTLDWSFDVPLVAARLLTS